MIRITEHVQKAVSGDGIVFLFAPHATGVLLIAEDEEGLKQDILNHYKKLFPAGAGYAHNGNAHSHLASTFFGNSLFVPVRAGKLQLGTWQDIFFLETDGPRSIRRVIAVQIASNP